MNTVPPNDFGHYEMLNELVQMEPAEALDPEASRAVCGHRHRQRPRSSLPMHA